MHTTRRSSIEPQTYKCDAPKKCNNMCAVWDYFEVQICKSSRIPQKSFLKPRLALRSCKQQKLQELPAKEVLRPRERLRKTTNQPMHFLLNVFSINVYCLIASIKLNAFEGCDSLLYFILIQNIDNVVIYVNMSTVSICILKLQTKLQTLVV